MKNIKKRLAELLGVSMLLSVMCVSVFAAEGDTTTAGTVISSFQSGFQDMASNALSLIAGMVPIALSVAGVIFLARKAMSWFKSLAK